MNRRQVIVGTAAFMTAAVVPVAASTPDYASVADIGPRAYGPGCRMYNDHGVYEIQWSGYDMIVPERVRRIAGEPLPNAHFIDWLCGLRAGHDMIDGSGKVATAKGEQVLKFRRGYKIVS